MCGHDALRRIYALRAQGFQELDRWIESYRSLIEEQFDQLDGVLEELKASKSKKEKARLSKRRTSKDGTLIAYEQTGRGPMLILVSAALTDRDGNRSSGETMGIVFHGAEL